MKKAGIFLLPKTMKRKINSFKKGELFNGVEFIKHITFGSRRKSMFKCTECKKDWVARWDHIRSGAKTCASCRAKLYSGLGGSPPQYKTVLNETFRKIKKSAFDRNIEFKISFNFVISLIIKNCEYCGCKPNQIESNRLFKFTHHGIDRVNNNLPYTESNSVACCITCNRGKNTLSIKEWNMYLKNLVNYRNKLKN